MDIIRRNFFNILRAGALNEQQNIEPMSKFKWDKLVQMFIAQEVEEIALKGIYKQNTDELNIQLQQLKLLQNKDTNKNKDYTLPEFTNFILNKRLRKIRYEERHAIDTSIETLEFLNLIISNLSAILNTGISLGKILELGIFLRNKGDRIDFVKLDNWIEKLKLRNTACLIANILTSVFGFEEIEIPFFIKNITNAKKIALRSIKYTAIDTSKEWHFRQTRAGFVKNNSVVLRQNLKRSFRFIEYAPVETISNFVTNFTKSLAEIEE